MKYTIRMVFFLSILSMVHISVFAMQTQEQGADVYQAIEKIDGETAVVETSVVDSMVALQKVLQSLDSFDQSVRAACASNKSREHLENQYKFYKNSKNVFLFK